MLSQDVFRLMWLGHKYRKSGLAALSVTARKVVSLNLGGFHTLEITVPRIYCISRKSRPGRQFCDSQVPLIGMLIKQFNNVTLDHTIIIATKASRTPREATKC